MGTARLTCTTELALLFSFSQHFPSSFNRNKSSDNIGHTRDRHWTYIRQTDRQTEMMDSGLFSQVLVESSHPEKKVVLEYSLNRFDEKCTKWQSMVKSFLTQLEQNTSLTK